MSRMGKLAIVLVLAVIGMGLSLGIGSMIFEYAIDSTYSQYELFARGKLSTGVDCVGNKFFSFGGHNIPMNKRTCSSFVHMNARSFLSGGDCEYSIYKGWYWGIGDFYYITCEK